MIVHRDTGRQDGGHAAGKLLTLTPDPSRLYCGAPHGFILACPSTEQGLQVELYFVRIAATRIHSKTGRALARRRYSTGAMGGCYSQNGWNERGIEDA